MIGLCLLMAGGESRMTGDCCPPERSMRRCVDAYARIRTCTHTYMVLGLSYIEY